MGPLTSLGQKSTGAWMTTALYLGWSMPPKRNDCVLRLGASQ